MFNKFYIDGKVTNNHVVTMNQPSTGFMQKSNPVSRFIRFCKESEIERMLFPIDPTVIPSLEYKVWKNLLDDPTHSYRVTEKEEVIVLQVCIFGNDQMLCEYVFKKDLDNLKD